MWSNVIERRKQAQSQPLPRGVRAQSDRVSEIDYDPGWCVCASVALTSSIIAAFKSMR
jgi:hypothetical protein